MVGESEEAWLSVAQAMIGAEVHGIVVAMHRWGVQVDLSLPGKGFIDPLYIDDSDDYRVGQTVTAIVSSCQERNHVYRLRPLMQTPPTERYRD